MRARSVTTTALVAATATAGALLTSPMGSQAAPLETAVSVRADVPTPEEFFGFAMGEEGRLASFPDIKR